MKMRVCTKCGEENPETDEYFYRHNRGRGGLSTVCKVCCSKNERKWRAENPEKVMESRRRWYAENPEKVMESRRRWKAENPEKVMESRRRWYAENPENAREARRKWRDENTEKVMEYRKKYYVENCEKVREATLRRIAENPEKVREEKIRSKRRQVNTLAPTYLKYLIKTKYGIDRSEIGEELMEAKRREITYYRQLKQLK